MYTQIKQIEIGGRLYTVNSWQPEGEAAELSVRYRSLRSGKEYGPNNHLPGPFETLEAAEAAIAAHAKKAGPYKPSGRHAEKLGLTEQK